MLWDDGNPMFRNKFERKDLRDRGVRVCSAPAPSGSVCVSTETQAFGEWMHGSPDVCFQLEDGSYFRNIKTRGAKIETHLRFHFPHTGVTLDDALCMREALIATLLEAYADRFVPHGWRAAVSTQAYANAPGSTTGLPIFCSRICRPCDHCATLKRPREQARLSDGGRWPAYL